MYNPPASGCVHATSLNASYADARLTVGGAIDPRPILQGPRQAGSHGLSGFASIAFEAADFDDDCYTNLAIGYPFYGVSGVGSARQVRVL
ncbi:MAG: hypothetical protein AAF699_04850 [Pseudomonadota bacterium]